MQIRAPSRDGQSSTSKHVIVTDVEPRVSQAGNPCVELDQLRVHATCHADLCALLNGDYWVEPRVASARARFASAIVRMPSGWGKPVSSRRRGPSTRLM